MTRWSTLPAGDVTLAVAEVGDPALPAAVLAHGVGSRAEFAIACWADAVAEAGLRLVTYDLRGHGRSTPLARAAEQPLWAHAADLGRVCAAFRPRLVGGFSLGALAALRLAAEGGADAEGLLLAMPALLGPGSPTGQANAATAERIAADGVEAVLADVAADPAVPPWVLAELRASWPQHNRDSLVAALRRLGREPPLELAAFAEVSVPVGIAAFADDPAHPLSDAEVYAGSLPRAAVARTTLADVGRDRSEVGRTAMRALAAATATR